MGIDVRLAGRWLMAVAVLHAGAASGQVALQAYGNIVSVVDTRQGLKSPERTNSQLWFVMNRPDIVLQRWTLKARINNVILPNGANVSGQPFPPEKIQFRFTEERIDGSPPQPWPTLAAVNANMGSIPFAAPGAEITLIPTSSIPLRSGSSWWVGILYNFTIDIAGGNYLDALLPQHGSVLEYPYTVSFTLYDENQVPVATNQHPFTATVQVHKPLRGDPVADPEYGIAVMGGAVDAALAFNTAGSYEQGVSAIYRDGLKVNSSTAYSISVRSMGDELSTAGGHTLPVSMLRVRLQPGSRSAGSGGFPTVPLAAYSQTLLSAGVGDAGSQFFDIEYSVQGNDSRLYATKSTPYSTMLVYQLVPR